MIPFDRGAIIESTGEEAPATPHFQELRLSKFELKPAFLSVIFTIWPLSRDSWHSGSFALKIRKLHSNFFVPVISYFWWSLEFS